MHELCTRGWDTPIAAFHIEEAKQYMLRFTACKLTWNHIKCRILTPPPPSNQWKVKLQIPGFLPTTTCNNPVGFVGSHPVRVKQIGKKSAPKMGKTKEE